jgi:hypothetical protein
MISTLYPSKYWSVCNSGFERKGHTGMPTVSVAEHAIVAAHKAALAAEQAAAAAGAASQAFEHGHTSDTRVATIGLIGALIGGLVTGGAQLLGDGLKRRQDRKDKVKQTQGVGRALRFYFDQWATMVKNRTGEPGYPWWTAGQEPGQHWDTDDVQLIAGSLDHDQWETVRAAMTAARNFSANRLDGIEKKLTVEAFFAIPEVHLEREVTYLEEGADTLTEVFN